MTTPLKASPWAVAGTIYLVWRTECDQTIDDAREVEADDPATAAEDWAEEDDQDGSDYTIASGDGAMLAVRPRDEPEAAVRFFMVSGEMVAQYHAYEQSTAKVPR